MGFVKYLMERMVSADEKGDLKKIYSDDIKAQKSMEKTLSKMSDEEAENFWIAVKRKIESKMETMSKEELEEWLENL